MEQNEEPKNKSTSTYQLIYYKGSKNTQCGNTVFSINGVGKTGEIPAKKKKERN